MSSYYYFNVGAIGVTAIVSCYYAEGAKSMGFFIIAFLAVLSLVP